MTTLVWVAVLGAALLHALWNSVVKSAGDKFMASARVALWTGVAAALAALATPAPMAAALPYVIASALIHIVYFLLVGRLYRNADLSVAYPLMRGLAPLLATAIAAATLREIPDAVALVGVIGLVVGVATMGLSGLAHGRIDRATLIVALANSAVIAVYSVIDGMGARLAGPDAAHAFGLQRLVGRADGRALSADRAGAARQGGRSGDSGAIPCAARSPASLRSAATRSSSGR